MADSATNIPQVSNAQAQHDVVVNALFDAGSPGMIFGRNFETTAALTFGYLGGKAPVAGEPVEVPNDTIALTASATNYIYAEENVGSPAGWSVVKTTSAPAGWPGPLSGTKIALYTITTGPSSVTDIEDHRIAGLFASVSVGGSGSAAGSDTQVQFNDGGTDFGGDAGLTYDKTANKLSAGGGVSVGSDAINAQTGTSYTLQSSDNGRVVTLSNASAITVTVPSGLGVGFSCLCIQIGAGTVTFAPSSTTLNSPGGLLDLNGQHAAASLFAYASNVFNLSGNLA